MTYRARPVTEAIIAALTAAGLVVGDGEKPELGGWTGTPGESDFNGYVVVHPIGATEIDGTLDNPSDDVWPLHQLTSYGAVRGQCEQIADTARNIILTAPIVIAGRSAGRYMIDFLGIAVRVDDVQPPIFQAPDRYVAFTTPS